MKEIKQIIDFVKKHGEKNENHTFFLPSTDITIEYNNNLYNVLYIGIFNFVSGEETPQFWAIKLDQNGEDTTDGMFFSWNDLNPLNQTKILNIIEN